MALARQAGLALGLALLAGCGGAALIPPAFHEVVPEARPADRLAASERLATADGRPARAAVLAPFEIAEWPESFRRIGLDDTRNYVVLAYLPPPVPFDLSSPEAMRETLAAGLGDPLAVARAKTLLGHAIVGWQCGPVQGVTSLTGDVLDISLAMLNDGWGLTAALSVFEDGTLYSEAGFNPRHELVIRDGRAVVTAFEVSAADCEGLRDGLAGFITHPDRPVLHYGVLQVPARFEGGGCLSFAWYLAAQAGVLSGLEPLLWREVDIHTDQIGRGTSLPAEVRLWPGAAAATGPVPLRRLLDGPWGQGPVAATVRLPDSEAFFAALVAMRQGLDGDGDWRAPRVMSRQDPVIARAYDAGAALAARYPVARIADPEGVAALVLERD